LWNPEQSAKHLFDMNVQPWRIGFFGWRVEKLVTSGVFRLSAVEID
jgi:hypothetical protein